MPEAVAHTHNQRPKFSGPRSRVARSTLALGVVDEAPLPTEFRLFVAGENATEKGSFLFDEEAAAQTMAAYHQWGVRLMIDLEHQSLEDWTPPEPTARDARGWCDLELRPDGSLWAVNVEWTPDGETRLREKRQRYISPAFTIDTDSRRVMAIQNIAITAMPATRGTPALMSRRPARDARTLSVGPSFSDITTAIDAALREVYSTPGADGEVPCCYVSDVFNASVVYYCEGDLYEVSYSYDGKKAVLGSDAHKVVRAYAPAPSAPMSPAAVAVEADPFPASASPVTSPVEARAATPVRNVTLSQKAPPMDPNLAKAIFDVLKKGDSKGALKLLEELFLTQGIGVAAQAEAPPPAEGEGGAAEDAAPADAQSSEAAALTATLSRLIRATAAESFAEVVERVEAFKASHLQLETERQALAAERAALESAERRKLGADLVQAGDAPASVWADESATALKPYLARMSLADLREFVGDRVKASKANPAPAIRPPVSASAQPNAAEERDAFGLTKAEQALCAEYKSDPATFAALKARRVTR